MKSKILKFLTLAAALCGATAWGATVAKVGETEYETLEAAIAAAPDDGVVTVLDNIQQDKTLTIEGKDLTLDLNGKTLTVATEGDGIVVQNATLNLSDSGGTGKYVFECTASGSDGIYLHNTREDGGSILNINSNVEILFKPGVNSAIHAYGEAGTAVVNMKAGNVYANGEGQRVSAVIIDQNAAFNMKGGTFNLNVDFDAFSQNNDVVGVLVWGQNGVQKNGTVKIEGGSFNVGGKNAFAQIVQVGMKNGKSDNVSVEISGGEIVLSPSGNGEGYVFTPHNAAYASATMSGGRIRGTVTALTATVSGPDTANMIVSGGTFSFEVNKSYCADGFTVKATTDADGNTVYGVVEEKVVDFAAFVDALKAANYTFDGSTHALAQGGKLTVKWSPVSGCYDTREGHECTVGNVAATANTPKRVNSDLAQFQLFEGASHAVSVKNVAFVYEPAAFTICANSGWKGSYTADQVRAGQIYLMNTGDVTFEGCSFDKVVLTSFNCTGTSTVKDCSFNNVYNSYAVKDIRGANVAVTGCTFENCGAAVMVSSTVKVDAVTIRGNTFKNVDVAGTAPEGKVGTRGLVQIASSGDYADTAFDFSGNTATGCGPVLRQLNSTVSFDADDKTNLGNLVSDGGASAFYTDDSFVAQVGDTKYATLAEAFAALSAQNHTLTLLKDAAWDAATPVYWAAGTQSGYAATLTAALTAAYKANAGAITIVCRPGADVGTMTHGHVADDLTIYGNKAFISGGECDLEVDQYKFSRTTGAQAADGAYLEKDITITAYELDNLGVWGERHTDYTVTVNLTDCDGKALEGKTNVQRVYISGTTGVNNITLTGCDFITKATAVYSNADGAITAVNCTFAGGQVPFNINHKANGAQTVAVENCTFTNCGDADGRKQFAAPLRLVNSGAGTLSAVVTGCTFAGTVGANGDILLGDGRTDQASNDVALKVVNTAANIQAQKPGYYVGETVDTTKMATAESLAAGTLETSIAQLLPVVVVVTDTASAQAALDAATPNTTIIFKSGTYEPLFIRQTLAMSTRRSDLDMDGSYPAYLRSFKNLTLVAAKGAEVVSQGITAEAGLFWHATAPASNQAEMNRATSGFISYLALENVTIDGIAFDSSERSAVTLRDNGAVATRGNIMVDGLTIQNCTGRGVASNKNIHFLAAGAGTNDQNFPGTEKKAFNNLVVKNCELDSYYQPIAFNNATAVLNGLTVTGNTFTNCADNQLQVANKINTGTFTITDNVFDGMSGRVIRLTNAQADSQFIITGNEIRNPKTYDSGLDSYSLTKITGVDGFRVTEQTDKGWTAGSYSADGKTWVADGDKKLLVYTYDAGMLKLGLVPLTDDEVAAFTGVNVQGLKGYDNKVYPTIQAAYDELSALVAAAGVGADGVVANDKVTGLYSQIDGNKIGISWNVWGEQVLPMGDTLALGRGQGYLGSYWIRNLSIKGRNEAAQVTASKITVPWSWQYPEVNDEESVILSISGLKLLDVDTTGISFARNGIGLAGTFTLNMTRCQVSGGINMAGAYQGNSVWNINDNVFTYRTGGYKQYAIMLNGTTAGDVAKGRSTTMNFIGNTVSGYDRGVNFSWVGGSVTASGNTITPGVGYSAIQLSNGVGTTQINGNTIHLNGGNVLTIHESCVGKTMSITVQGNAIDGMGYAVYDDVAASGKDYGSSEDKANVTLVWSGNTVADGAAMDTEKGIKGTSETDLSEYVYTVLNPAGARVRHGDTVTRYPTLAAAIDAAQAGDTVELIREGTYTLPAIPLNITVKGTVEGVAFNCQGSGNIASVPNGATFENVEFTFGNSIYHGFQHAGLITMNNCTLNGLLFSYGDMAFNGCTFVQEENEYCMWCYGKNVTYTGCTFNTAGKALNVYNEGDDAGSTWNINVVGCTFNSTVKNKAAVNIEETCGSKMLKYNVTVTDCTIGTPDFYPTGTDFNPANALWVISPLVQVDDRNTSVYPSESGITVTMGDECVYPMATMLQLPVTADGGTKLLLTVPDTFFTGVVTYPAGATADEKSEIQSAYLATVEANGLKVWQNYVMGVDGSVAGNKLLTDYVVGGGAGDGEWITVKTPIAAFNPPTDSGITVKYRLLRTTTPDDATSWQAVGELTDTPSFPVNIAGQEDDTFWKIEVVF